MALGKVIFGCVTDRDPKFLDQAVRLVSSLRWFGGSVADAPFIVCSIGSVPLPYADRLFRLGAQIRTVETFDARHGPSNKLRFLELAELEAYDVVALMDCDTIIVQDPYRYLPASGFAAKPADLPTVTVEQFQQIFSHFRLAMPPADYIADVSGVAMLPYFNAGVCLFARNNFVHLRDAWIRWNRKLLEAASALDFPLYHADQASLTLALADTGIAVSPLPPQMNLPVHLFRDRYPPRFQAMEPVIIHYHAMTQASGEIAELPLAGAERYAQMFNARWQKEGTDA